MAGFVTNVVELNWVTKPRLHNLCYLAAELLVLIRLEGGLGLRTKFLDALDASVGPFDGLKSTCFAVLETFVTGDRRLVFNARAPSFPLPLSALRTTDELLGELAGSVMSRGIKGRA